MLPPASAPRSGRPVASMICAVTKTIRLLLIRFSDLDWNKRPMIGMITEDRHFVLHILHIFTHQPTDCDGVAVIDGQCGVDPAGREHRHFNTVFGDDGCHRIAQGIRGRRLDRATVVDEAFELDDFRNEAEVDHEIVFTDGGFDFKRDAGIAGLERGRSSGGDREAAAAAATSETAREAERGSGCPRCSEVRGVRIRSGR